VHGRGGAPRARCPSMPRYGWRPSYVGCPYRDGSEGSPTPELAEKKYNAYIFHVGEEGGDMPSPPSHVCATPSTGANATSKGVACSRVCRLGRCVAGTPPVTVAVRNCTTVCRAGALVWRPCHSDIRACETVLSHRETRQFLLHAGGHTGDHHGTRRQTRRNDGA